jgi:hypothetical protein
MNAISQDKTCPCLGGISVFLARGSVGGRLAGPRGSTLIIPLRPRAAVVSGLSLSLVVAGHTDRSKGSAPVATYTDHHAS